MAVSFKNYSAESQFSDNNIVEKQILVGASGGTIVKSLELINSTNASCDVHVFRRKNGVSDHYADIKIELKANDYLLLWDGFFVIEADEVLSFQADASGVVAVASVVEF